MPAFDPSRTSTSACVIAPMACVIAPMALGLACADEDVTPPELQDARFVDLTTLVLRFSEPIAAVVDVDPSSHFRLSTAMVVDDPEGGEVTVYYDLAHHFPDGLPGQSGDAAGLWFRHGFTLVAGLERGDEPNELRVLLSYPLESYVCDALSEAAALDIPAGIHVHYAQAGFPRIEDEGGNPLADIGGWWLGEAFATTNEGRFPEIDPRLPIPCLE